MKRSHNWVLLLILIGTLVGAGLIAVIYFKINLDVVLIITIIGTIIVPIWFYLGKSLIYRTSILVGQIPVLQQEAFTSDLSDENIKRHVESIIKSRGPNPKIDIETPLTYIQVKNNGKGPALDLRFGFKALLKTGAVKSQFDEETNERLNRLKQLAVGEDGSIVPSAFVGGGWFEPSFCREFICKINFNDLEGREYCTCRHYKNFDDGNMWLSEATRSLYPELTYLTRNGKDYSNDCKDCLFEKFHPGAKEYNQS